MNPYLVLNVPEGSDDAAIRAAYLAGVKAFPPEYAPLKFQALNTAYESIRDEARRHAYTLFDQTPIGNSPIDALIQYVQVRGDRRPIPHDTMKALLKSCTKT